jgi:hypothetical protein
MFMSSECCEWLNNHPYLYSELKKLDNKIMVTRNETERLHYQICMAETLSRGESGCDMQSSDEAPKFWREKIGLAFAQLMCLKGMKWVC